MRISLLLFISLVTLIGLLSTGFNQSPEPETKNCTPSSSPTWKWKHEAILSQRSPGGLKAFYQVNSPQKKFLRPSELLQAKTLEDLIPDYPTHWIQDYQSVEIRGLVNQDSAKAFGSNIELSPEQLKLIQTADMNSSLEIRVGYATANAATGETDYRTLKYYSAIAPEQSAQFPGGHQALLDYLKNEHQKMDESDPDVPVWVVNVSFQVDPNGKVVHVQLDQTSGDPVWDQNWIELVQNLPTWSPALDGKGNTISQQFIAVVGNQGC
ncbi:energy transducer TonB [bacterium SCSIO 12741]|nr:energy transducer TonB [bacterium SCSIO 12741]